MKKLRTCGATALQRHENVAITSKTCSTISATGRYVPLSAATPPSRVVLVGAGGRTDGRTGIPDETLTTMLARILPLNAHGLRDLVDGCRTSSFAYGVDNYRHKGLN